MFNMKLSIAAAAFFFTASASAFVPLEGRAVRTKSTTTSLNNDMWGAPTGKSGDSKDKSKALPFASRPKLLDGSMAADVGFE
jgi:hypothetical protein